MKKESISTSRYVLPNDIQIVPVRTLSKNIQEKIGGNKNDFVVSRKYSRHSSIVVNDIVIEFLKIFERPIKITDAVHRAVRINGEDPEIFLEKVFPIVKKFISDDLLLLLNSSSVNIKSEYKTGDIINGYKIIKQIQMYEESEVYQVVNLRNDKFLLKIVRDDNNTEAIKLLENEIQILKILDGKFNPVLEDTGFFDNKIYLITKWFDGIPSIKKMQRRNDRKKLIGLCTAIIDAYAHLHKQGVIHSDVHPANILVNDENKVMIIDYGYSFRKYDKKDIPKRAGIAYFYEPEFAMSKINQIPLPHPTEKGEQYSLGALLYLLLTGKHYLQFSLEKKEMFQQIHEGKMLSFTDQELEPWPEMEKILQKMLDKDPEKRFRSLQEITNSIKKLKIKSKTHDSLKNRIKQNELSYIIDKINQFEEIPPELRTAPTSSVAIGMGGVAYCLYRLSCIRNDPKMLAAADLWITRALKNSQGYDAFYNKEFGLDPSSIRPESLYYHIGGLYCVQGLISKAMNDSLTFESTLKKYIEIMNSQVDNIDLNVGKAGMLLGCSLLLDVDPKNRQLIQAGNNLCNKILNKFSEEHDNSNINKNFNILGMAHGWAGILYAIIRWYDSTSTPLNEKIKQWLKELSQLGEEHNNNIRWPCTVPKTTLHIHNKVNSKYVPWWCGGSAGFVHLFTLAYEMLGEIRYLELAKKSTQNAYEEVSDIGDLCCGYTGRAYSFLNLYKHTKDKKLLSRTKEFAQKAISINDLVHRREYSLYKGMLGTVLLLEDMNNPENSCMPLFEKLQ